MVLFFLLREIQSLNSFRNSKKKNHNKCIHWELNIHFKIGLDSGCVIHVPACTKVILRGPHVDFYLFWKCKIRAVADS